MDSSQYYTAEHVDRKRRYYTTWFWASVFLFLADLAVILLTYKLAVSDNEVLYTASTQAIVLIAGGIAVGIIMLPVFFLMIGFNRYKQKRWQSYE